MKFQRVLLVEDDAVISALLGDLLADLGHFVCGMVTTELDAIAAAAAHSPDLMLVDVQLKAGNGLSAMRNILRQTVMPHIYMTGGSRQSLPLTAPILHKPFSLASLSAALDILTRSTAVAPGRPKYFPPLDRRTPSEI